MNYCYFNGEIISYKDCSLHISDLQFQRGYGVFDFFRCHGDHIPWLRDYMDRLFNSIGMAELDCSLTREYLKDILLELKQKNQMKDSAFKVLVTGGYSENLGSVSGTANVAVLQVPWKRPPASFLEDGVNLISDAYQRPMPEVKSLFYMNTLRQAKRMKEYQAVDVLFHTGHVSECSRASVFYVKDGKVRTTRSHILPGITRKQVLSLFPEIVPEDLPFEELFDVDELFITSTSTEVTPVVAMDGRPIGNGKPGPLTLEIQAAYRDVYEK